MYNLSDEFRNRVAASSIDTSSTSATLFIPQNRSIDAFQQHHIQQPLQISNGVIDRNALGPNIISHNTIDNRNYPTSFAHINETQQQQHRFINNLNSGNFQYIGAGSTNGTNGKMRLAQGLDRAIGGNVISSAGFIPVAGAAGIGNTSFANDFRTGTSSTTGPIVFHSRIGGTDAASFSSTLLNSAFLSNSNSLNGGTINTSIFQTPSTIASNYSTAFGNQTTKSNISGVISPPISAGGNIVGVQQNTTGVDISANLPPRNVLISDTSRQGHYLPSSIPEANVKNKLPASVNAAVFQPSSVINSTYIRSNQTHSFSSTSTNMQLHPTAINTSSNTSTNSFASTDISSAFQFQHSSHAAPHHSQASITPPTPTTSSSKSNIPNSSHHQQIARLYQLILNLTTNSDKRELALFELSKQRETYPDLAPILQHSVSTIACLMQEIIFVYPLLQSPQSLTSSASSRCCNALSLLQCVASHTETRSPFLKAHIPLFLYPFLNTTHNYRPFEYLRLTSLGVIGALVKVDDPEVISFLLQTEIIPLCLRIMDNGSELSKTVATFIIQKILLDSNGLNYICATSERFYTVNHVFSNMISRMVASSTWSASSNRLFKHILRCFLRFSDNQNAREALRHCLPKEFRSDALRSSELLADQNTRKWLSQLLQNLALPPSQQQPISGSDGVISSNTLNVNGSGSVSSGSIQSSGEVEATVPTNRNNLANITE